MNNEHEVIYLIQTENLESAWTYLFEKYFEYLYIASMNYVKKYCCNYLFDSNDIHTMCYLNFVWIIKRYNLKNQKYIFAQALFQMNRSLFRNQLVRNFCNFGLKTLSTSSSYDDIVSYIQFHPNFSYTDDEKLTNRIQFEELRSIIFKFLKYNSRKDTRIMELYFEGASVIEIARNLKIKYSYVQSFLKSLFQKVRKFYFD